MATIKNKFKSLLEKKSGKVTAVVLCVGLGLGGVTMASAMGEDTTVSTDYTVLQKTDLTDSISVKGIVESSLSRRVYSNLNYNVAEVYVSVGDTVKEGDILAQLDTVDLELKISQKKEDLSVSERNNANQLQNSQRLLSQASSNLNNGTNTQIVSGESSLKTAETNLQNARKAYDDAISDASLGINSKVAAADSALESAKIEMDKRENDFTLNKALYDAGGITLEALNQSERDYTNAKLQYDDAVLNLENAKTSDARAVEQAEESLETAQIQYDNAQKALSAAKTAAAQEVSNYQNSVSSAQIAVNNNTTALAIEELEKEWEDATIRSPIDGTITAVFAKEGVSGQGLLFVVEDVDDLKIQTYIKEYDVAQVKEGMAVVIKSDATGDREYEGIISKIEPAAVKTNSGETASASDVEFGAEVGVVSGETDLKIGMNTRMNIILNNKSDIYRVPFDGVKTYSDGTTSVFLIDDQNKVQEVPVTTGLETDFYIEVEGASLFDGAKIANDAAGLESGAKFSK